VDRDSPLGQPGADLSPGFGLPTLPRVHALLRHHELRELIPRHRLDQPGDIGAGVSQLEEQVFRRDADRRRRGGGQDAIGRDTATGRRGSFRAGVNDGRSLSWVYEAVNPHLVPTVWGR
jgi:hypothetical protein